MAMNMATASRPPASTRQSFTGRDDVLLLARMESLEPWNHAGGVMDAWKQLAGALNSDPECTLTCLTTMACRGRFHRMVTQRKEGQDKMLRRGVANQGEYELKLAKLDALISSMDGEADKAAQVDALYDRLMKDTHSQQVAQRMQAPRREAAPTTCAVPQQREELPCPPQRSVAAVAQVQRQPQRATAQAVAVAVARPALPLQNTAPSPRKQPVARESVRVHPLQPPANIIPMDIPTPRANAKRPAEKPLPVASSKRFAIRDDVVAPTGASDIGKLISVAERAVELLMRKIEQDQEIATAERQWRREQARAHRETMEAMEQQTNQLKAIALEYQWKGL